MLFDKNNERYEGFLDCNIPSPQRVARESEQSDQHTLCERPPIGEYIPNAFNMMRDWSKDRLPDPEKIAEKIFYNSPGIFKNHGHQSTTFYIETVKL